MIDYAKIERLVEEYSKLPLEILEYLNCRLSDAYLSPYRRPWDDNDKDHKTAIGGAIYRKMNAEEK